MTSYINCMTIPCDPKWGGGVGRDALRAVAGV